MKFLCIIFVLGLNLNEVSLEFKNISTNFILDFIKYYNIKNPKVFLSEDTKMLKTLWKLLSSMNIQAIVTSKNHEMDKFIEIIYIDDRNKNIFVYSNSTFLRMFLETALLHTFLHYHSTLIMFCHDCNNVTFYVENCHDILGDVIIGIPKKEKYVLYGLTFNYRDQSYEQILIGYWDTRDGIHLTRNMPNALNTLRFHGATLRILVTPMAPYVYDYEDPTGKSMPNGSMGLTLDILSKHLDFRYNVSASKFKRFGEKTKYGNYTQSFGEFLNEKFDIGLGIYSMTSSRITSFDFTRAVSYRELAFTFQSSNNENAWKLLLNPFSKDLWKALAWATLLFSLLHFGLAWFESKYPTSTTNEMERNSTKILVITFSILYFTAYSFYNANLVSSLTVDISEKIKTFEQLAQSKYAVGFQANTSLVEILKVSNDPSLKAIYRNQLVLISGEEFDALDRVCYKEGNFVYLAPIDMIKNYVKTTRSTNCSLYYFKQVVFIDSHHLLIQKDHVLSKRLSTVLLKLNEGGILDHLNPSYTLKQWNEKEKENKDGSIVLNICHFTVPFGILIVGYTVSIVALIVEMVAYKYQTYSKNSSH